VKIVAVDALANLGVAAAEEVPALDALTNANTDFRVAAAAIEALQKIRP